MIRFASMGRLHFAKRLSTAKRIFTHLVFMVWAIPQPKKTSSFYTAGRHQNIHQRKPRGRAHAMTWLHNTKATLAGTKLASVKNEVSGWFGTKKHDAGGMRMMIVMMVMVMMMMMMMMMMPPNTCKDKQHWRANGCSIKTCIRSQ